ncbi:unnamed protein product [Phaeothamnion confervicola]
MRLVVALVALCVHCASAFLAPGGVAAGLARASTGAGRTRARPSATAPRMAVLDVGSEEDLDKALMSAGSSLVVVDYSTTWCGPCKVIFPKYEALSEQYKDAIFLKVMGDSSPAATKLMKREGVRSVPSFHFWKTGKKVDQVNGANADALESTLREHVS